MVVCEGVNVCGMVGVGWIVREVWGWVKDGRWVCDKVGCVNNKECKYSNGGG